MNPESTGMRLTSERSSCDETTAPALRRWAVDQLRHALPRTPMCEEVVTDVELVVSELVTNGIRAGCRAIELSLTVAPDDVTVEVAEDAPGWPAPCSCGPSDDHGRGLALVEALTQSDWGVRPSGRGKAVWARLPRQPVPA